MKQEYLFVSDEYKEEIENFTVKKASKEIETIENSDCWLLCLNIEGENEDAAKILDKLNSQICEKYKPTVLTNGCSAYFNKSLFPIINEFERNLRKLLYLASALQEDSESNKVIIDLEAKDLGEIFTTLFTDSSFVKKAKDKINKKTWQFTKNEILANIDELDEDILWDTLLGVECVETLRKNFNEVKRYRNDVMHAHNIDMRQSKAAKKLFHKINDELDDAIQELIGAKEENELITPDDNFNNILGKALTSLHYQIDTDGLYSAAESFIDGLQIYHSIDSELLKKKLPKYIKFYSQFYKDFVREKTDLENSIHNNETDEEK